MKCSYRFSRIAFLVILLSIVLAIFVVTPSPAAATSPTPTAVDWGGNFTVRSDIPFLWLRNEPSSNAGVVRTLYPGGIFATVGTPDDLKWDGVQWWGQVNVTSILGWVEVTRIVRSTITTPTAPAPPVWIGESDFTVRSDIPFLWLRNQPSSNASVIATINHNTVFITVGGSSALRWDGVQWWGQVNFSSTAGWVEVTRIVPSIEQDCRDKPCRKQLLSPDGQHQWQMNCTLTGLDFECNIVFPNGQTSTRFGSMWSPIWSADTQFLLVSNGGSHDTPPGGYEIWDMSTSSKTATIEEPMLTTWIWWSPTGHILAYIKLVNLQDYSQGGQLVVLDAAGEQHVTRQCPDWVMTKQSSGSTPLEWNKLCNNWTPPV